MIELPDAGAVERFRAAVTGRLGLHLDDSKRQSLADLLRRRVEATDLTASSYLARIEAGLPRAEWRVLLDELTVAETYFFRHGDQLRALTDVAVPARMGEQADTRRLSILSAGCATGEEPYTLAMLLRGLALEPSWELSIRAVDVNPTVLERARRRRYSRWVLRETPTAMIERWFGEEGRDVVLDPAIAAAVTFEERNLTHEDPDLWRPASYDIVFCRNVIMYLTADAGRALMTRVTGALRQGGYLFLGHAENLRGLSDDYHLRHTHGTFYYQRSGAGQLDRPVGYLPAARLTAPSAATPAGATADGVGQIGTWVDAIHRATARIQVLSDHAEHPVSAAGTPPPDQTRPEAVDLGTALDLVRHERYAEALDLVRAAPAGITGDPDALLLEAVLLTHSGELVAAERACRLLLAADELNAGAHYVLAICHEGAGEHRLAIDHDQVAAYLDPGFAMPHLHLGLLSRRAGDHQVARRALREAVVLLQREEPARLLLFGGGFSRAALITLCRSELDACGDRA